MLSQNEMSSPGFDTSTAIIEHAKLMLIDYMKELRANVPQRKIIMPYLMGGTDICCKLSHYTDERLDILVKCS